MAAAAAGREDDKLQLQPNSWSRFPSHLHHAVALDDHDDLLYHQYSNSKRVGKEEQKNIGSCGDRNQQQQYIIKNSSSWGCNDDHDNYKLLHPHPGPAADPHNLQLLRGSKSRQRTRHPTAANWVVGSGGMRAIFLDSRHKPCTGTGVFLPRNAGASNSLPANNSSSACSPVLLPARVVQALNLNLNDISLQVTRPRSHQLHAKSSLKPGRINNTAAAAPAPAAKNNNSASTVELPQNENASPEIFLPKEWTY